MSDTAADDSRRLPTTYAAGIVGERDTSDPENDRSTPIMSHDTQLVEQWAVDGGPWTLAEWLEIRAGGELSPGTWGEVRDWYYYASVR